MGQYGTGLPDRLSKRAILTDGLDSLFSYALYLPVPNGMTEDEWGADRFGKPSDTLRRI